ncbi:MAG: alkaline shock response membrane anchor protein AmaP [Candidatus Bipolaricaulota bacterium]|nr:alkaline shock response membrane anchor protein AmaP [Candidatus Bipolaricaulota bacterium]MCS7274741.1 alkaline shock response membrane anchor protein AmaP [Candidatus Bipolaricaulota bacterium]MDW8110020.1 alkaline shock response membrane anchor protein AmaP [Candidatus Bipolaricaulota bacterium]MDW8328908.1 alkaline shock response membrane anchor protein AmaP [Candidatus Bipolaricaulota bacterium]
MKRASDLLIELLYVGAFLSSWLGAVALLLVAFRWLPLMDLLLHESSGIWVIVVLDLFAAIFFLVGLYFLAQWIQSRRRWRHIQHESPRGPVKISLFAIRSYIEKLLQQDFGLARFRVALENRGDGLDVVVRAELPIGENVLHTAERIQKSIEESVEDRVGVKVRRVQIIAAGIVTRIPEEKPLFQGELE